MSPEGQERQSRKWRSALSEYAVWLVMFVVALILYWASINLQNPNDPTGGAPQHAVVHDPEAEHIRVQDMALVCASAINRHSYARSTGGQLLETIGTGVNDARMKTHDAYYTDDTIEFVGVRYRGIPGNVICHMDGKRVVEIRWNFPHTGREIQLWRDDR